MRGLVGGDGGDAVTVFVVEAAQHVEDLGRVGDRLAEVAESVGELLQFGGVVGDAEVGLVQTSVFGLQVDGMVELMVAELVDDGAPDREGGGAGNADDAHDVA